MENFREGIIKPRPEDLETLMARGLPKEKAEQILQERLSRANAKLRTERRAKLEAHQPRYDLNRTNKPDNPRAKERPRVPPSPKMPEQRPGL